MMIKTVMLHAASVYPAAPASAAGPAESGFVRAKTKDGQRVQAKNAFSLHGAHRAAHNRDVRERHAPSKANLVHASRSMYSATIHSSEHVRAGLEDAIGKARETRECPARHVLRCQARQGSLDAAAWSIGIK